MDLIDRQAALKAIQDLYPAMPRINFGDNISNWQQKYRQYIECENVIRILPTAERKGHWMKKWHTAFKEELPCCSECNNFMAFRWDYCPNCGARMELE